jgi:F-type H+-transporting ATPase subunit a
MVDITAQTIGHVAGVPVTNSFLATLCISFLLVIVAYIFSRNVKEVPGKFQNLIEYIVEFLYNTTNMVVENESRTKKFFPLIATFFLFILFCNWAGLLPIFGTMGFGSGNTFVPLFRPMSADLNATVVLAIISAIATQYFAIKYMGLGTHLKRYFSLNPLNLYIGLLELLSEFTKVISLSFRLYGNILAGDIVIATFTSFIGFLVPLPFMGLEIVVGFVQAAVFAMLSLAFTNVITQKLH